MLCYKNRSYCMSSDVCRRSDCKYKITPSEQDKAEELQLPIAWIDYRAEPCCPGFVGECRHCKLFEESTSSPEDGWCHKTNESTSACESCDWFESAMK